MGTLKISDLSVGDWVKFRGNICTICSIYQATMGAPDEVALLSNNSYLGVATVSELSPIPITPEILEANGFFHNGKRFYTPELSIILERGLDVWTIILDGMEYTYDVCIIKYVHQLQHALRLAGVEKEIVMPEK